jgi:uncharacterized protein
MKILVFTDTHNSTVALKKVVEKAKKEKPDLMLCCGDFTIFMQLAVEVLDSINSLKIKTYIIHGNHEDAEIVDELCKKYKNIEFLHNKVVRHEDVLIMGYGGGGFAKLDSNFKEAEKKFENEIGKCRICKKIMIVHQPPHKTGIDLVYGEYAGNITTRKFIDKHKIDLVFAGHLHENAGKEFKVKYTKFINPGPYGKIIIV